MKIAILSVFHEINPDCGPNVETKRSLVNCPGTLTVLGDPQYGYPGWWYGWWSTRGNVVAGTLRTLVVHRGTPPGPCPGPISRFFDEFLGISRI